MIDLVGKDQFNQTFLVRDNGLIQSDESLRMFLDRQLWLRLSDLSANKRSMEKLFGFKKMAPIHIGEDCLLFPIEGLRGKTSLLLNRHAITGFRRIGPDLVVSFGSGHELRTNRQRTFLNQLKKCDVVISFLDASKSR